MNLGQPERMYIQGISFGIPVLAIQLYHNHHQTKLTVPPTNPIQEGSSGVCMNGMMYIIALRWLMAYTWLLAFHFISLISNVFTIVQYGVEAS
jgi:YidC/Oxa1 family membrane protein insertase